MASAVQWTFEIDSRGRARSPDDSVSVRTVQPGEYLITLPSPVAQHLGLAAHVCGDAFLAATPGDDAGNKPNIVRVLTFDPRTFTLVLTSR
jgi:hypothetical protein